MKIFTALTLILSSLAFINTAQAQGVTFSSTDTRNTLLELYTSEGCSSCPPADRWLSQLKQDPRLWQQLFPVAFHVDYWNYLGWRDEFSQKEFTDRQQTYAAYRYANTVYTPGFFNNGREWRGWFSRQQLSTGGDIKVGRLSATISPESISASFTPAKELSADRLNVAILGLDRISQIRSGENSGKTLQHDFVVIEYLQFNSMDSHWDISDKAFLNQLNKGEAVVLWVTQDNDPTPIQTTGGLLP